MNKELKSIKLANLKLKCSSLKIKQYGTKLVVFDRIKKHYADNKLGKFNLKDFDTIQFRCRISNRTKIDIQIRTAWNLNNRRFN